MLTAAASAGAALVDAEDAQQRRVSASEHNGWLLSPADVGQFGTDYATRAITAQTALASNINSQALYPSTTSDSRGRPLDGRRRYTITFKAGALPPVFTFWSLTLYSQALELVANPIDRFSIGDRTQALHYGSGGSLTIYVQHDRPGPRQFANWLPAPAGRRFVLWLRLYDPRPAAAEGRWQPPPVIAAAR